MANKVISTPAGVDVILYSDLDANNMLPYADGIVAIEVFTKKGNETPIEQIIDILKKIKGLPEEKKPKFVTIVFGGWDEDKRPVISIPECNSWCRKFIIKCEPKILSVLMWEPEVIASTNPSLCDAGFGIVKILATGGYGYSVISPNCDASVSAINSPAYDKKIPIQYYLSNEGMMIAKATIEHKYKCN